MVRAAVSYVLARSATPVVVRQWVAGAQALLLQLAHPWVATAITEHSTALSDPIGRFHRTFEIVHSPNAEFTALQIQAESKPEHGDQAAAGLVQTGPFARGGTERCG